MKPLAFIDTECYPNYWLLRIKTSDGIEFAYRLNDEYSQFDEHTYLAILSILNNHTVISFNGKHYDITMIEGALAGYTPNQLKWLNDKIIGEGCKPWDFKDYFEHLNIDHIDLFEVAPGKNSLKQYAGRLHSRRLQDLPYDPSKSLTKEEQENVCTYCGNDIALLIDLYESLKPQLHLREIFGDKYGIDLRSKSDAQMAETILWRQCEQTLGRRIYKPELDTNFKFRYDIPEYISYSLPQLQELLTRIQHAIFYLDYNGVVKMPQELEGFTVGIGKGIYKVGIGGLHSQEKQSVHLSDEHYIIRDNDVASYYPSLIINSKKYPPALGQAFQHEYKAIVTARLEAKALQAKLKKAGDTSSQAFLEAQAGNEGGKIMINGTFGKCGSPYSILFAPEMLIQTTVTGQLSLLMLIEWHEHYGINVISANTDGIVIKCPRDKVSTSEALIAEWQKRTNLEMETVEYSAIYSRDVNNYFAVKTNGEVKRKGEYSKAGLIEKKNPDCEIASDAVAEFLAKGTPIEYHIASCVNITKFFAVQKVAGGGVKMWGEGPRKDALVRDKVPTLEAHGWVKQGRVWVHPDKFAPLTCDEAYRSCFQPQTPEYLGKVIRWYYGTRSPGPVVYSTNGNTVGLSYGAKPCMTLPESFPDDIDYHWYINKAKTILCDIGYTNK